MKKENISPQSLLTAWENKNLVTRVLKKAHVYRSYSEYEDLFHEGLITYARLLDRFKEKSLTEINKLAYKKIFWKINDELRKEQRRAELFLPIENQDFELEEELSREDWLVLANELGQLTEIEMVIFREHFIEKCALKTLASNYNSSLRTLSRKKRELIIRMKAKLKRC